MMGEQHFNTVSEIAVWRSEKIEVELAKTTIETMLFLDSTHIFFSEIKFKIIYLQFLVCENKKSLIKMFEERLIFLQQFFTWSLCFSEQRTTFKGQCQPVQKVRKMCRNINAIPAKQWMPCCLSVDLIVKYNEWLN